MTTPPPFALRGDRPIESAEEDRLGRAAFSRAIASQILEAPALDSYVVAIMGPWGSGKTSLVNMIAEEAQLRSDAIVLKFNPWIFSGTEQLVGYFFRELGAQLSELRTDRLSEVGASLKRYAGLFGSIAEFIPTVGTAVKKAADVVKDAGAALSEGPSIMSQRDAIRQQLNKIDKRIIVLVDDIDRLRPAEIREVVKLVRLTGDFPNIVYVLAFDRQRVESALGDDGESGRAYLEKIVQVAYDVPLALAADISKLLLDELSAATQNIEHGPFDQMDWQNIFHNIIRPLFRSPRDVRRYVNALPPTLRVIGKEVALGDVLALEAVRVFLPDLFLRLPGMIDALTTGVDGRSSRTGRDSPQGKAVEAFVADAGKYGDVVRELLQRVFPHSARFVGGPHYAEGFARTWHRTRRVAAADVFRFYLERRLPEGVVAAAEVQSAFALLGDRNALSDMLGRLEDVQLENLLGRLETFEDEFRPEHVEPAIGALLDQVGRLREGKQHFFDLGADLALDRVVLRLLRREDREAEREAIVTRVLPTLRWFSAQRALVRLTEGHKLAGDQAIAAWKKDVIQRFAAAHPNTLGDERHLDILIAETIEAGGANAERVRQLIDDDVVLVRVLSSAMGEQSSWSPGDAASRQQSRLPWKSLISRFGERLEARVREARAHLATTEIDPRGNTALDLAVRYASGWRPNDRSDETETELEDLVSAEAPPSDGGPVPQIGDDESDAGRA